MNTPLDPETLSEESWRLISQAVTEGKMTLINGRNFDLDLAGLLKIAQWLATSKAKRPRPVSTPEDFQLKKTIGEEA